MLRTRGQLPAGTCFHPPCWGPGWGPSVNRQCTGDRAPRADRADPAHARAGRACPSVGRGMAIGAWAVPAPYSPAGPPLPLLHETSELCQPGHAAGPPKSQSASPHLPGVRSVSLHSDGFPGHSSWPPLAAQGPGTPGRAWESAPSLPRLPRVVPWLGLFLSGLWSLGKPVQWTFLSAHVTQTLPVSSQRHRNGQPRGPSD